MDVSIIIINYNTSNLINDCIESIFKKVSDIEYEIIIVDNNTENLSKTIDAAKDSRIQLLQLDSNIGFGRANNAGAKIARGRNLFLLNPDTILLNNAVKILSDYLDTNLECGACGGNLYDNYFNPIHSYRMVMPGIIDSIDLFTNRKLSRLLYGKNHQFNHTDKIKKVGYITGADLMIPCNVFTHLHGFDGEFFMYYEETDLCKRINDSGKTIISVPMSKIIHLVGKSHTSDDLNNFNPFIWKCVAQSRKIYYSKHLSPWRAWISRGINKFNYALRIVKNTCCGQHFMAKANRVLMKEA